MISAINVAEAIRYPYGKKKNPEKYHTPELLVLNVKGLTVKPVRVRGGQESLAIPCLGASVRDWVSLADSLAFLLTLWTLLEV